MRIGLQTWGSEGDIRPFLALGHGLAARGHTVELVYTEIGDRRYEHVAQALGFTARAVGQPMMPRPDDMLRLESIAFEIQVSALYRRVEF